MTGRYPPDDKDDFNVLPKKFHTGGVVRGSGLKGDEVPLIASQGGEYVVPTVTGRWSGRCPARSQEPRTDTVDVTVTRSDIVGADFSEIEKRVMAQMAVPERMMGKKS